MPLTFKDFMALFLSPKGPLSLFALLCSRLISLPTVPSQSKACPVMEIDWLLLKIHVAQVVLDPFWTSQGPFLLLNSWTGQNHFHFHLLLLKLTCLVLVSIIWILCIFLLVSSSSHADTGTICPSLFRFWHSRG